MALSYRELIWRAWFVGLSVYYEAEVLFRELGSRIHHPMAQRAQIKDQMVLVEFPMVLEIVIQHLMDPIKDQMVLVEFPMVLEIVIQHLMDPIKDQMDLVEFPMVLEIVIQHLMGPIKDQMVLVEFPIGLAIATKHPTGPIKELEVQPIAPKNQMGTQTKLQTDLTLQARMVLVIRIKPLVDLNLVPVVRIQIAPVANVRGHKLDRYLFALKFQPGLGLLNNHKLHYLSYCNILCIFCFLNTSVGEHMT
jgi:hypothetical protein